MEADAVRTFWRHMGEGQWDRAADMLDASCTVIWPCTGEVFTKNHFIAVNRAYPGRWAIHVESCAQTSEHTISVVRVESPDHAQVHYAVSFFTFTIEGLIREIREYWSSVDSPPEWRRGV